MNCWKAITLFSLLFSTLSGMAQEKESEKDDQDIFNWDLEYDSNEVNIISFRKSFSPYRENWEVKYSWFKDVDDDFIIPLGLSYGYNKVNESVLEKSGYMAADVFAFGFGADGYIKLDPRFYLGVGAVVSPGIETTKSLGGHKSDHFYIGADFNQGLRFMPWRAFGIVLGVNFYQKLQNSKVYTSEVGWSFEVGINF